MKSFVDAPWHKVRGSVSDSLEQPCSSYYSVVVSIQLSIHFLSVHCFVSVLRVTRECVSGSLEKAVKFESLDRVKRTTHADLSLGLIEHNLSHN